MRQLSKAARSLRAARAYELETRSDMDDEVTPDQASEWLGTLLERPDDAGLRQRFDAWLVADPANAADWAEIARTYEVMGRTPPAHRDQWAGYAAGRDGSRDLPAVPAAWSSGPDEGVARRVAPRRTAIGFVAAALAACLLLAAIPGLQLRLVADHVTTTAELRTLRLADGSSVRLGPESAIEIADDGPERGLRLLRGTAYFEVAPDPSRPFKVRANLVEATVLGTAFEVRLDDEGAGVAVRHGSVRVERDGTATSASETLAAGDWVTMANSGEIARGTRPPDQVAAWLDGHLIARDLPVGEVVEELRRYYRGLVILHGDGLARQPLTGIYDLADPVAALEAVAGALDAKVYLLSPWLVVISAG